MFYFKPRKIFEKLLRKYIDHKLNFLFVESLVVVDYENRNLKGRLYSDKNFNELHWLVT